MIGQAIGAGLGLATAKWQDKRQIEQQQKLQNMAIEGSKQMGAYNQQLALDMWEKTNYDAQRKQMQKAGLNVGLMYGGGGAGGGTTSTPTGNVGAGTATGGSGEIGMGMQTGMQMELLKAQKENIEANTQKTKVDTAKTAGVDTEAVTTGITATKASTENIIASTNKMKAETDNTKLQGQIMQYQKELQRINANVAKGSEDSLIKQNNELAKKYAQEVRTLNNQNEITEKTKNYQIEQARLGVVEANMRIKMAESGIEVNQAQITKMAMDLLNKQEELRQNNRSLDQKDVDNMLKQWQTEFNIGSSTQGGIMNAMKAFGDLIPF